jgi:hypothetical protein
MRIINDYGLVRVISLGDPFHNVYDIQVQVKDKDSWELYHGFNSLSDDYAYTNAREAAGRAIRERAAAIAGASQC